APGRNPPASETGSLPEEQRPRPGQNDKGRYDISSAQAHRGRPAVSAQDQDGLIKTGAILRGDGERLLFQPELFLDCGQGHCLAARASELTKETRALAPIEQIAEHK